MNEIIERRLRTMPPVESVVPGSTPVPSFGDAMSTRVLTLGINPSQREFLDAADQLLVGTASRFVSLKSLNRSDLLNAPMKDIEQVYKACCDYFAVNPYRRWFNVLNELLQSLGVSYYEGSAAHVDLVQWATRPVWGKLPAEIRFALIADGKDFLDWQLSQPHVQTVLINGRTALDTFVRSTGMHPEVAAEIPGLMGRVEYIYRCQLNCGGQILGWTTNLQSSFGVTKTFRRSLADAISRLS